MNILQEPGIVCIQDGPTGAGMEMTLEIRVRRIECLHIVRTDWYWFYLSLNLSNPARHTFNISRLFSRRFFIFVSP